jgi:hypothetical protein
MEIHNFLITRRTAVFGNYKTGQVISNCLTVFNKTGSRNLYTFSVAHSIIIENKKCGVLLDTVLRVSHISEVFVRKWPQQQQWLYHRQLMSAS